MSPDISLKKVTRRDVERVAQWLGDDEVCSLWFGKDSLGEPIHLGYLPSAMVEVSQDEWDKVFEDPHRRIFSVYTAEGEHIGEAQMVVEEVMGNAELSLLIGRKDLWHRGYGMATARAVLDLVFYGHRLYRAWVDVPAYNTAAVALFQKLGFVHEGILRKSRPYRGIRADSYVMGLLAAEYFQQATMTKVKATAA